MYLKGGVQLNIELVEISRIYIPSPVHPIIRILTPRAPSPPFQSTYTTYTQQQAQLPYNSPTPP